MYKTAISRAFLSTPSNHGCVKSSAIYILLGRMTFAISVIDYLRRRGCPALAPLASHQMLCFLYFGDRWPPLAPFDTFFDFFYFSCFHSFYVVGQKCVPRWGKTYNFLQIGVAVKSFRVAPHLKTVTATVASKGGMCTFSVGKVTSIEMRLCNKNLFSTFSLMSFLFRLCNS